MKNTNNLLERVTSISISDYGYDLPDEKIAKYPLAERDHSKLLVWNNGQIKDSEFGNLPEFLPLQSLLIFNNTKVIRARLHFQKETGAKIEIFCLDPINPADYQIAFQTTQSCIWKCMIGNQKKWKGELLHKLILIDNTEIELCAEQTDPENNKSLIRFSWNNSNFEFSRIIEHAGLLPIPPYLNRETEQSDLERYQTVYSKRIGSLTNRRTALYRKSFQPLDRRWARIGRTDPACGCRNVSASKKRNPFGTRNAFGAFIHQPRLPEKTHPSLRKENCGGNYFSENAGKPLLVGNSSIK
jgi:S-adenosylmethionine:tRNA ribosyltransferase-isomerase